MKNPEEASLAEKRCVDEGDDDAGEENDDDTSNDVGDRGLGLVLGAFAALIFGLSIVQISHLREGKLPAAEARP